MSCCQESNQRRAAVSHVSLLCLHPCISHSTGQVRMIWAVTRLTVRTVCCSGRRLPACYIHCLIAAETEGRLWLRCYFRKKAGEHCTQWMVRSFRTEINVQLCTIRFSLQRDFSRAFWAGTGFIFELKDKLHPTFNVNVAYIGADVLEVSLKTLLIY